MLFSAGHSRDFDGSRSEYIYLRLRLLSFGFAVLALLWIPVDFFFLDTREFSIFLALRLGFSGAFLLLGLWTTGPHSLPLARLRLALLLLIPAWFYAMSRGALGGGLPESGVLVGYSFLPYVMVSLLAIFPLTLAEGFLLTGAVVGLVAAVEGSYSSLAQIRTLGEIWLLLLLAAIAIWAQMSQLHMLLRLYREATRDALTGIVNRRLLMRWLALEVGRAKESGEPLSVLLVDLDLFKRINDSHGHLAGDSVLQHFAQILTRQTGGSHLIGRYGGEEFLMIMPGKLKEQAQEVAERIRLACHDEAVSTPKGGRVAFTVSIGVAQRRAGESARELLQRVDVGLYKAKEGGRDMVVVAA